ncbi:hypothetical protein QEN19_004226 [Hanseniaspora menglaensis]
MSFEHSVSYTNSQDNISIRSYKTYSSVANSIFFNGTRNHKNRIQGNQATITGLNRDNVYFQHMDYEQSKNEKSKGDFGNVKDDIISLLKTSSNISQIDTKKKKFKENTIEPSDLFGSAVKPVNDVPIKSDSDLPREIDDYLIFLTNGKLIYSSLLDYYNTENLESDLLLEISVLSLLLDTLDYNIVSLNNSSDNSNIYFYYNPITPNIKIVYRFKSGHNSILNRINLKDLDKLLVHRLFHLETLKKRLTKFEGLDLRYDLDFKKIQELNKWVEQQTENSSI